MKYTSRSLRRRGDSDKWEAVLMHKDPLTGEPVRTYHTVEGKTQKAAERARDDLIMELELKGGAVGSTVTVKQFMDSFLAFKEASGTVEPSTIRGYRYEAGLIERYIGAERLCDLSIAMVGRWMADMSKEGYAPKSVSKAFRLLKQALKLAVAQDFITKNPCDFCKPPKRVKTPINALSRGDRSRMLLIARRALPTPLSIAIELALTTGMRRGEVCALRWSDLGNDGTITVNRALGNADGGFYEKEPKTLDSKRTIPLTAFTTRALGAIKEDKQRICKSLGVRFGDPYILGTIGADSKPYNPTQLGKDFAAFCKMNGFDCTFHDLRHTFATFLIGSGTDVRTVAGYLGHSSVTMTLETYADVDPEAKFSAVSKIEGAFDVDGIGEVPGGSKLLGEAEASFTVEELRMMLAEVERKAAALRQMLAEAELKEAV